MRYSLTLLLLLFVLMSSYAQDNAATRMKNRPYLDALAGWGMLMPYSPNGYSYNLGNIGYGGADVMFNGARRHFFPSAGVRFGSAGFLADKRGELRDANGIHGGFNLGLHYMIHPKARTNITISSSLLFGFRVVNTGSLYSPYAIADLGATLRLARRWGVGIHGLLASMEGYNYPRSDKFLALGLVAELRLSIGKHH